MTCKTSRALTRADLALTIRDQFQSFGIDGLNYSVCFSARPDYFVWLAEPSSWFIGSWRGATGAITHVYGAFGEFTRRSAVKRTESGLRENAASAKSFTVTSDQEPTRKRVATAD